MTPVIINQLIRAMDERMQAAYTLAEKVATLSTAVLAFTVTFAKSSSGSTGAQLPVSIKLAWLGFLVAVLGSYLVHHSKIEFHRRTINALRNSDTQFVLIKPSWQFHVGRWMLSVGFMSGMILLVIYGWFYA